MERRFDRLAAVSIAAAVLSFMIFALSPVAIICGALSLRRIGRPGSNLKGKSFAVAGIALGTLALVSLVSVLLGGSVNYKPFKAPAASMMPLIRPEDRMMIDMRAYVRNRPERGDIVLYESFSDEKRKLGCKRIAGLPGEELEIKDGKVYIDGMAVVIRGLPAGVLYTNAGEFAKAGIAVKIPEGAYFLLGDNPSQSIDSRQHGFVDLRDIKGKYLFAYKRLPIGRIAEFLQRR